MRGYRRNAGTRMVQIARATDDLSGITALTNGYWWHARNATGIGTAAFKVPESGGHTTFDLVQATVAAQPTVLTENGGTQFRMTKAAAGTQSILGTAGSVQAGWTGPTYVGLWYRLPDNAGISSGGTGTLAHTLSGTNNRRFSVTYSTGATPGRLQVTPSSTGLLQSGNLTRSLSTQNGNWHYIEMIFDFALALGGSAPNDVVKHYSDLARQALTTNPSTTPTALFDANCNIYIGQEQALNSADNFDWASCYYCNGIPSIGDRRRMAGYYPPRTITF